VAQPPLPLQEFLPAQECFSTFAALLAFADLVDFWPPPAPPAGAAFTLATVPPNRPVKAAATTRELFETLIFSSPFAE
jgi:hypothetical protein